VREKLIPNNFIHQWAFRWRSMPTGDDIVRHQW